MSGEPLRRTRDGVVHDPRYPDADGPTVIRAGLRAPRRFRVVSEVTGEDCTVEVLAEFLAGGRLHSSGLPGGLDALFAGTLYRSAG